MKITKSKLKQMIKEELKYTLLEIRLEESKLDTLKEGEVWDTIKWMFKNPKEAFGIFNGGPKAGDSDDSDYVYDVLSGMEKGDPGWEDACWSDPECRKTLEDMARQKNMQDAAERQAVSQSLRKSRGNKTPLVGL